MVWMTVSSSLMWKMSVPATIRQLQSGTFYVVINDTVICAKHLFLRCQI